MKKKIIVILLVLLIPFMLFFANIQITLFNEKLHKEGFVRHGSYGRIANADEVHAEVLSYLKGEQGLETDFFNEREKSHIADVKQLIKTNSLLLFLAVALFVCLTGSMFLLSEDFLQKLGKAFIGGSLLSILLGGVFWLLSKIGFCGFFTVFHKVLFPQGNWSFDPAANNMVVLYPPGFWQDMFMQFFKDVLFWAFVVLLVGILLFDLAKNRIKHTRKKNQ